MNIFSRMSQKALKIISKKSDGMALYISGSLSLKVDAVIEYDVEKNPGDLLSGVFETITAIDLDVTNIGKPKIGALILIDNNEFKIDEIINFDKTTARVSVN